MQIPHSRLFRYGIALVFVGAALGLSLLVRPIIPDGFLIFFLSAVMLAGWFGRTVTALTNGERRRICPRLARDQ